MYSFYSCFVSLVKRPLLSRSSIHSISIAYNAPLLIILFIRFITEMDVESSKYLTIGPVYATNLNR